MDIPAWHAVGIPETLQKLQTRSEGLTAEEVTGRLAQHGRNEIIPSRPTSPGRLLLKQFANYFIFVLFFAAALAFAVSYLPGASSAP